MENGSTALEELQAKAFLEERLKEYVRADDILNDFSVDAAKTLVKEMYYGKYSSDRKRAADSILDRSQGKPIDRMLNINMEIPGYNNDEMDYKIKELMNELGFTSSKGKSPQILVVEEDGERQEPAKPV